jgi:hypothetical protein
VKRKEERKGKKEGWVERKEGEEGRKEGRMKVEKEDGKRRL